MLKSITENYDITAHATKLRDRGVTGIEALTRLLVPFKGGRADGLTDKEHSALMLLSRVYVATTDQLGRYLFSDSLPSTRERKARRYAQRLARYQLVVRQHRAGMKGQVLTVTPGHRALRGYENILPEGVVRPEGMPYGPALLRRLKATELYVRLIENCRHGGPQPQLFAAFPDGWRKFIGVIDNDSYDDKYMIRPDAAFRLPTPDGDQPWLVTFYDGSEADIRIARTCEDYYKFAQFQIEREHTVPSRVLLVVEASDRASHIQSILARQPERIKNLFTVSTMDDAVSALTSAR
ncbi:MULTISPECIES: replication-relaxation family protein [unclassified Streptomyces]|uniref:Replication-relaxation family protein n=1 Tax=Streptomyces sp. NBC_00060 TaxID=2975636 RepID=A0AAU2H1N5_9ACTN